MMHMVLAEGLGMRLYIQLVLTKCLVLKKLGERVGGMEWTLVLTKCLELWDCVYVVTSTHQLTHTFIHSFAFTQTQPFRNSSGSWKKHLLSSRQPRSRGGTNKCSRASKLQCRRPSLEVGQLYNSIRVEVVREKGGGGIERVRDREGGGKG